MNKIGLTIEFTIAYSPLSSGINEQNHYSAYVVIKKIMDEDRTITLEDTMSMAAWTHNTNTNENRNTPLTLATEKSVTFSWILGCSDWVPKWRWVCQENNGKDNIAKEIGHSSEICKEIGKSSIW